MYMYRSLARKRAHYEMSVPPPPPQSSLDFSLSYLKERPTSASIADREFPLSSLPEDVVRLVYTTLQAENYTASQWFTLYSTKCKAHDVVHYLHRFVVHKY